MDVQVKDKQKPRARTARRSDRSALERALDIIGFFDGDQRLLTLDHIADRLGTSRSSCYRYVRALRSAGLLTTVGAGQYCLGPRIVELERRIRLTDPLLYAGEMKMKQALETGASGDVLLLCSYYGDKVLCIHQEGVPPEDLRLQRTRGVPFPMFEGPASTVILANLPIRMVKALYLQSHHEIANSGLGTSWSEFNRNLRTIRRRGFAFAMSVPVSGLGGVAVAIFADGSVVGSLTLVRDPKKLSGPELDRCAHWLTSVAEEICFELGCL